MKKYKQYEQKPRLNNQIRVPEVDVVDDIGAKLGIMATSEALKLALSKGLDLVEIAPQMKPPLVKILDFGKYMYQKGKKGRGSKDKSASQEIKTVKIGFRTDIHDLTVKANQSDKFLKKGHRVLVNMLLKGREKAMGDVARSKMENFLTLLESQYEIESSIKRLPNGLNMIIKPTK